MKSLSQPTECRNLVVILGDQLDINSTLLTEANLEQDLIWMCEAADESSRTWSSKQRIVVFLSAMRHFRDLLINKGYRVEYRNIEETGDRTLDSVLLSDVQKIKPRRVMMTAAGEMDIQERIKTAVDMTTVQLVIEPDRHFLCSLESFNRWADGRKQLRMENFYRVMRKQLSILMEGNQPVGGRWNFDSDNRKNFGRTGPGMLPPWPDFQPDRITRSVIRLIEEKFGDHPGSLDHFGWPVTRQQALLALKRFVEDRLPLFGHYQDAMWSNEPHLYHSGLAVALNLKLLNPREVVDAVIEAYTLGRAPLSAVEGFIRQVIGWREFIRGIYWRHMPEYERLNELDAHLDLPDFYWTGNTDMECMKQTLEQTLYTGYAHHIQRLMVTGLYALLLGVKPGQVHRWYLSVYVDAVEWVEMPNTLGMSQYADGGLLASKPYAASGRYIDRMSDYCRHCRYKPDQSVGPKACPFTTLYWDFLDRHRQRFERHPRAGMQWRNLDRLDPEQLAEIRRQAAQYKSQLVSTRDSTTTVSPSSRTNTNSPEDG